MLRQNLKIIGNRETHPLTWLPKLNYIAKNIGPKNYIFKYPTTKILFVIKKLGMPRYQIISKLSYSSIITINKNIHVA